MTSLYIWPDSPFLSLVVLLVFTQGLFYAARVPLHRALRTLAQLLGGNFRLAAKWLHGVSESSADRRRELAIAIGKADTQRKIDREFRRIESSYGKELSKYPELHQRMDGLVTKIDGDFEECASAPPEAPGWSDAVKAVENLPKTGDRMVEKVIGEMHKSVVAGEKKSLQAYRGAVAQRHKILSTLMPHWKQLTASMKQTYDVLTSVQETSTKIDGYMDKYEKIQAEEEATVRSLTSSAINLFVISTLVMAIAVGGAFINFQLIALPMSELVPSGARLMGAPISTVAALVIVLMEMAAGIFVMEMLGVTNLFPKMEMLPRSRRRIILVVALGGLFLLAGIESSLAILREQIVEADAALKQSLAGVEAAPENRSQIPIVGQAVLGFILPWILAMVAVPLEMMIGTFGQAAGVVMETLMHFMAMVMRLLGHTMRYTVKFVGTMLDIYIIVPLQIERAIRGGNSSAGRALSGGGLRNPADRTGSHETLR